MPPYRYYAAAIAAAVLLATGGRAHASSPSGPGDGVYQSIKYLWDQAPKKFSGFMTENDWAAVKGKSVHYQGKTEDTKGVDVKMARSKDVSYDIPEFEDERMRVTQVKKQPPNYIITSTKKFTSDAACTSYYNALLKNIPIVLAGDRVKVSKKDDHVFFIEKAKSHERKVYVKRYLSDSRSKKPRIVLSVRVEFPE